MSVAEEIRGLVQARQAELDQQEKAARGRLNDAISAAHDTYDAETKPLLDEADQLNAVLQTLGGTPADPQTPSEPESPASSPSDSGTDAPPASDTAPTADSTPTAGPSTPADPSQPSDATTPPTDDAPSTPSEPSEPENSSEPSSTSEAAPTPDATTAVPAAMASVVEPETPVQVSLPATGEIKVVTAQDVLDAADPNVPDSALSEDAKVLRNSDYA